MPANAPYDYKVVPAPRAARRIKGARGAQERFARTLEEILAEEAAGGWEFLRAEHLEIDEKRSWLSRARPTHRSVLVFRRGTGAAAPAHAAPHQGHGAHPGPAPERGAPPAHAQGGMMDPDVAWARAQSPAAPDPAPAPAPAARSDEPVLRLAPSGRPASLRPDPDVHPDPDAPRIGPAER